jgi:hypothetical protein
MLREYASRRYCRCSLRINDRRGVAGTTGSNDKREEPTMKNALRVITGITTLCVRFVEDSRQRRMLRAMQELGHPGVLADIKSLSLT